MITKQALHAADDRNADRVERGRYNIIYVDPPWNTKPWGKQGKATRQPPYKTMTNDELVKLPVDSLAATDTVLFMWVLDHKLEFALSLGNAWGFGFVSVGFYWFKRTPLDNGWNLGTGYGTRAGSVEQCWQFSKGKGLRRVDKGVRRLYDDIIIEPIKDHSRKPDDISRRIERLYGDVPRVELFARRTASLGWDVWGNEVISSPAAVGALGDPVQPAIKPDVSDHWVTQSASLAVDPEQSYRKIEAIPPLECSCGGEIIGISENVVDGDARRVGGLCVACQSTATFINSPTQNWKLVYVTPKENRE